LTTQELITRDTSLNRLNHPVCYKPGFRFILLIAFFIFNLVPGTLLNAQSYGLQFASRDADPEKRTSLDLTPDENLCPSQQLKLSFDLTLVPNNPTYFGYVFRIINDKKQNLDMLYDQQRQRFQIVFGDSYTDIDFSIDPADLLNRWIRFTIAIDFRKGVSLYCNDKFIKSNIVDFKGNCVKICFGASHYVDFKSTDVTPMKIRNIGLDANANEKYFWPLNESSGTVIKDSIHGKKAVVVNSHWLKPRHSNWELLSSFVTTRFPGVAFDPGREQLYIVAKDSLYTFSAKTSALTAVPLTVSHGDLLPGNQAIFNSYNQRLYNFYIDQHFIAEYNFTLNQWSRNFAGGSLTDYWHVNKFFSKRDSSLYVLAGYGHLRYKNKVQRHNLADGTWDTIKTQGDYFTPRYLSGLGSTPNGDSVYILGGYGSKDGDQLLNPKYFYDLLFYDVPSRSFKKVFSLKEPEEPFVVSNSLVIDADRKHYYALIFSKDQLNTHLQLIKGSLRQPEYELIGSPFPYTFFDINSFSDFYYCPTTQLFLAVTLYTNKDNKTEVKIYSINFPPNRQEPAEAIAILKPAYRYLYFIAAGIILAFLVFLLRRTIRKRSGSSGNNQQDTGRTAGVPGSTIAATAGPVILNERDNITMEPETVQDARIYLFGNFEVIASNGENITKLFTPLLKELFLLLCIHSIRYNKGVSPEKLIETLWNNKETKDAINNRSVNIAKLKSILEKIEGCLLHKESGYWKIDFNREKLYIDFDSYARIFSESTIDNRRLNELISITQRGAFLPQTDYHWADHIKSEISNFIIDALLRYCQLLTLPDNAEKIITVCNSIFSFDELNENALRLKCKSLIALGRHTLAKHEFEKFITKFKEIYGEDYKETYNMLINS
jgi:two-component SAPR family response regulator